MLFLFLSGFVFTTNFLWEAAEMWNSSVRSFTKLDAINCVQFMAQETQHSQGMILGLGYIKLNVKLLL